MIAALALITIGCATTPPEEAPPGACDAEGLGDLVGQAPTPELGAEAQRRSGARALRWIRPGDAVTMDYRVDRLNVHLDASHHVERFACG